MLTIIALIASVLVLAIVVAHIRFVAPAIRERHIREAIALGHPVAIGAHRAVKGYGRHLAA